MIVGKNELVCLRGSGRRILFAECGPFCALQKYCEGVQIEIVMPEVDVFVSSTSTITLDHNKKLKNNTGSQGLEGVKVDIIKPLPLRSR